MCVSEEEEEGLATFAMELDVLVAAHSPWHGSLLQNEICLVPFREKSEIWVLISQLFK